MKTKLNYLTLLIALGSLVSIAYGFFTQSDQPETASKFIGFGTVGLFLVAMPLFLITASRGKKVKDYMLTDENIRKMRGLDEKEPENQ